MGLGLYEIHPQVTYQVREEVLKDLDHLNLSPDQVVEVALKYKDFDVVRTYVESAKASKVRETFRTGVGGDIGGLLSASWVRLQSLEVRLRPGEPISHLETWTGCADFRDPRDRYNREDVI